MFSHLSYCFKLYLLCVFVTFTGSFTMRYFGYFKNTCITIQQNSFYFAKFYFCWFPLYQCIYAMSLALFFSSSIFAILSTLYQWFSVEEECVCVCVCMRECVCVCQFCFPEDTWQCLETFLVVSQLGEGSYKHLVDRELGCC